MEESRPGLEESRDNKSKAGNRFYISGIVCGRKINFLLDSGSTASFLSSAEYRKLPPELSPNLQPTNMSVLDLTGHVLLVHDIGQFQVCLDVPHKATSLVVDKDLPAILGQNFLLEFVDHTNYKTKFLHTERSTIQCWTANDQTATEVNIKRTVSIPANHFVLVPVSLADGSDLAEIAFLEQLSTFDD